MGASEIIGLLGGIALFLFGMAIMGDGLKKVAGSKLELVLYKLTSTPLKGPPGEEHPVPQGRLIDALAPAGVPDGRVRHPLNLPALQPGVGVLYPADLRELLLRRPPDAHIRLPGAAVQL